MNKGRKNFGLLILEVGNFLTLSISIFTLLTMVMMTMMVKRKGVLMGERWARELLVW